jgi:hypothetical protein
VDTAVNAETVAPWGSPSALQQVITVTPLANRPNASRSIRWSNIKCPFSAYLKSNLGAWVGGVDPLCANAIHIARASFVITRTVRFGAAERPWVAASRGGVPLLATNAVGLHRLSSIRA